MSLANTAPAQAKFVFGTRDEPGRAIWLLLGPCLLYLVVFSLYPLFHSLRLSLTDDSGKRQRGDRADRAQAARCGRGHGDVHAAQLRTGH